MYQHFLLSVSYHENHFLFDSFLVVTFYLFRWHCAFLIRSILEGTPKFNTRSCFNVQNYEIECRFYFLLLRVELKREILAICHVAASSRYLIVTVHIELKSVDALTKRFKLAKELHISKARRRENRCACLIKCLH